MTVPAHLSLQGVNAHYGRAHILFDLALDVRRGEVLSLLGRNGAGKSTTLKAIIGIVRATAGQISFDGARIDTEPVYRISRLGLGYVPEERRIFTELTRLGGRMSGGEQQMLAIARTLMGNPSLILLDEPSEGLSPKIVEQLAQTILDLRREQLTIVLSEQNLHFARHVADRAMIIEKGRLRYTGTMAELAANEAVQNEYLSA